MNESKSRANRKVCFATAVLIFIGAAPAHAAVDSLRVMTLNIMGGGLGTPAALASVIQAGQADIIGIQEAGSITDDVATVLGFNYHVFNGDYAFISRYPITQNIIAVGLPGIKVQLSPGQEVYVFDAHLPAFPYQPYQIRDGVVTTEAQAISAAQSARGAQANNIATNIQSYMNSELPVFLVGDFNEPSHFDWTQEAADAALNFGMKVNWPTSNLMVNAGLADSFRELRPDEVNDRAETWTPRSVMPATEVHDRIDFVYYKPGPVLPIAAYNIGGDIDDGNTDFEVSPYPTDHRGVVVQFDLSPPASPGDFNVDGIVDALDYAVWRNNFGDASEADLNQNGNGLNGVDEADFNLWKQRYGNVYPPGAGSSGGEQIPEPTCLELIVAGLAIMRCRR